MNRSTPMRLVTFVFLAFALATAVPFASRVVSAQELSVGVVDKAQVANASKAWKTFKKQLDVDVKRWQKKVRDSEAELAKQGKALLSSKDSLSPSALRERQVALQKRQQKLNEELGKSKRALDQRVQKAEQILNKAINEAASAIGRERGLSFVLNSAMVIHSEKSSNISKEVAERVNKNLKHLPKS